MRLTIRGETSTLNKPEARFASHWATRELLGRCMARNIICCLEFKDLGDKEYGSCIPTKSNYDAQNPRKFKIEITNASRRNIQLITLFHEFYHLKQYVHQELIQTDDVDVHYWRRRYLIDEKEYSYSELPWEKEAFRFQDILYHRYNNFLIANHISFVDR